MPSHLTRLVFRQILANRPILHRDCLRRARAVPLSIGHNGHSAISATATTQRRSFWANMGGKPERQPKEPSLLPGFRTMAELTVAIRRGTRYPEPSDLKHAFHEFVNSKREKSGVLEDSQLLQLKNTYEHLTQLAVKGEAEGLDRAIISKTLQCLRQTPKSSEYDFLEFAHTLYESQKQSESLSQGLGPDAESIVNIACNLGKLKEAREYLKEFIEIIKPLISDSRLPQAYLSIWANRIVYIMIGRAKIMRSEADLLGILSTIESYDIPLRADNQIRIAAYHASKNNFSEARNWLSKAKLEDQPICHQNDLQSILLDCIAAGEHALGNNIVRSLMENESPSLKSWQTSFFWAVATGKGVDEVDRMFKIMRDWKHSDGKTTMPNIEIVNTLVELAIKQDNAYLAERLIALGRKWDIRPNVRTYVMQIEYRISAQDLEGAQSAYKELRKQDLSMKRHGPAVNRLIQEMFRSKRFSSSVVMNVIDDLVDADVPFEAQTVAALAKHHLDREELHDAIDLIQTHTFKFSLKDRALVRDVFLAHCLDRRVPDTSAWDAYVIFHQLFDETPRPIRTRVMTEFFARSQSEMACHVFTHMRHHTRDDTRADETTYTEALKGAALARDPDALELVHNELKLDASVEPSTRLLNALILAHTQCGHPRRALEFWEDIRRSPEGPSYASIALALRACGTTSGGLAGYASAGLDGEREARRIWSRLRELDVQVDEDIFAGYAAVLAGSAVDGDGKEDGDEPTEGTIAEAIRLMERARDDFGITVNAKILGAFYNATAGRPQQGPVEAWARAAFPDAWAEMEKVGFSEDEGGWKEWNGTWEIEP